MNIAYLGVVTPLILAIIVVIFGASLLADSLKIDEGHLMHPQLIDYLIISFIGWTVSVPFVLTFITFLSLAYRHFFGGAESCRRHAFGVRGQTPT